MTMHSLKSRRANYCTLALDLNCASFQRSPKHIYKEPLIFMKHKLYRDHFTETRLSFEEPLPVSGPARRSRCNSAPKSDPSPTSEIKTLAMPILVRTHAD
jgi:hypothetical protein